MRFQGMEEKVTSYFDTRRGLFRGKSLGEVLGMEREMCREISELTSDPDFPEEWREKVRACIDKWLIDRPEGAKWFAMVGEPNLVAELHSLFHRIGGARIKARFGILSDNPNVSLVNRRAWEIEHGGSHDGEASGPTVS